VIFLSSHFILFYHFGRCIENVTKEILTGISSITAFNPYLYWRFGNSLINLKLVTWFSIPIFLLIYINIIITVNNSFIGYVGQRVKPIMYRKIDVSLVKQETLSLALFRGFFLTCLHHPTFLSCFQIWYRFSLFLQCFFWILEQFRRCDIFVFTFYFILPFW
jgi:hypothetical protein